MAIDWDSFVWAADEWIVNYSLPAFMIPAVKLFSAGHALELHLKAADAKITGSIDHAVAHGHNIPTIWAECKSLDPAFLPSDELRPQILARDLLNHSDYGQLAREDLLHFIHNQEIYVAAKYLADIKYFGAPLKKVKGAFAFAVVHPNPIWSGLFKRIRAYLGHPTSGKPDRLRQFLEVGDLPDYSARFLREILD